VFESSVLKGRRSLVLASSSVVEIGGCKYDCLGFDGRTLNCYIGWRIVLFMATVHRGLESGNWTLLRAILAYEESITSRVRLTLKDKRPFANESTGISPDNFLVSWSFRL
jgi:hypothetical protein